MYPPCSEDTHPITGDATCNPLTCDSTHSCTGQNYQREPFLATGENWLGILNAPYGQSNWSPEGVLAIWESDMVDVIESYAAVKHISSSEINIIGPSVAHKATGMKWANAFYPGAKERSLGLKALNMHAYQMNSGSQRNGPCFCDVELLRDQLSYMYTKFNLPIWLTEFNCGSGFWNCPLEDHQRYMAEVLPMLEEHPFVSRYAWMSALTDADVMLNNRTTFELNELGQQYNSFKWNGTRIHNPQWGPKKEFTFSKFSK